jgi:hypothetical protein
VISSSLQRFRRSFFDRKYVSLRACSCQATPAHRDCFCVSKTRGLRLNQGGSTGRMSVSGQLLVCENSPLTPIDRMRAGAWPLLVIVTCIGPTRATPLVMPRVVAACEIPNGDRL